MQRQELTRRLESAARFQAAQLGFAFGADSWSLLRDAITMGVDRIITEHVEDNYAHLALADAAVHAFVTRMVIEAQTRDYDQLREDTFYAAKAFFCPLWPIC